MIVTNSKIIDFENLPDPLSRFSLVQVVGEGSCGEVHLAVDLRSDNESKVAVKIIENIVENLENIEQEFHVLKNLTLHPNLPQFFGIFMKHAFRLEDSQIWFAMELCEGGSAADLAIGLKLQENRRLSDLQISYILKETVDALVYLHEHNCIHRDIKGHNILFTKDGRVKLTDFGLGSQVTETKQKVSIGSPFWMAPEIIKCDGGGTTTTPYDTRCDIWSLGITTIELAEAEPPMADLHPMRALFQIPRNPPPTLQNPLDWSRSLNDFIADCLIKDFEQRPFALELKEDPFLLHVNGQVQDAIRVGITQDIDLITVPGKNIRREPEILAMNGKLKTGRKSRFMSMFVDDLASMTMLDEETVLDQVYNRFEQNQIYTFVGDVLLSVNPCEDIGIYTNFYQKKYRASSTADLTPHIFGLADRVYHQMLHQKVPQVIILHGESGSGKTENMKLLLRQLVYLAKAPNRNLESKILQVNPIMEAFGNAATKRHSNSSRFSQYMDVTFTRSGKLSGIMLSAYSLETTRVTHKPLTEKNFHVFYYLVSALNEMDRLHEFHLDKTAYKYLQYPKQKDDKSNKNANDDDDEEEDNADAFVQMQTGLQKLGFTEDEITTIYKILAAILCLGEIDFDAGENVTDGCSIINHNYLDKVGELLGISSGDLGICLTTETVQTPKETFSRRQSFSEAQAKKCALARNLYSRLFGWLVNQINALIGISRQVYGDELQLGLMDSPGFEKSDTNSLEQLLTNVTSEQLQFYFNQYIFTWEQQEYMAEGLNLDLIHFTDNLPVLDLCLGKPNGILERVQQEFSSKTANEHVLFEKLFSVPNRYIIKSKQDNDKNCFVLRHYADKVKYDVKDFLQKNRPSQINDHIQLLKSSSLPVIRNIFECTMTKTGELKMQNNKEDGGKMKSQGGSLADMFRSTLIDLMTKVLSGEPHFVLCVQPRDYEAPIPFDQRTVLNQLRNFGILEAVKIRQSGYSHRFTFVEFLKRYCFLAFSFDERVVANKETCRLLLLRLKLDGWAIGKTKVFLKYYHVEYLAKISEKQIRSIVFVQACVRRWLAKVRLQKSGLWLLVRTVVSCQKAAKIWKKHKGAPGKRKSSWLRARVVGVEVDIDQIKPYEKLNAEKAAIRIQSHFRGFMVRKKWGPVLEERIKKIVTTHKTAEGAKKALEAEGLSEEDAAVVVQRFYRRWKVAKESSMDKKMSIPSDNNGIIPTGDDVGAMKDAWDTPFKLVEKKLREIRSGKKDLEKVDIVAYRQGLIMEGLQSQLQKNQERERNIASQWTSTIKEAAAVQEKPDIKKKPLGKLGKRLLDAALRSKSSSLDSQQSVDKENF